ncbi:glycosyltransferase family 4 protein [Nitrococcus mobilis]|uniref:Glycosyl transferase, group 1 family protein n=1 Tax=Nitrococcus mobilis Nb-231 TaxID=314278 RepID=A4BT77_9GAMM|nr:glycosyltransferase family 4 protein [Nitrococcus mobilis]EAR21145.1 glycosyl transferase, group 1 family protein [Nitrococcus mobilis Nb-231]
MLEHLRRTQIPRNQIIVLLMQGGKMQWELESEGFTTVHAGWHRSAGLFKYRLGAMLGRRNVRNVLKRTRDAVLVCNTFRDLSTSGAVAAHYGLPIVWRARADTFVPWSGLNQDELSRAVQFINKHVTRVVATTQYEAAAMVREGVRADMVTTIYNGVPLRERQPMTGGQGLRQKLSIPDGAVVAATVARLIPQKGFETLLPAMAAALSEIPHLQLVIAGDSTLDPAGDVYKNTLLRLRRTLGLEEHVHFLGFTDDVAAVLKAADFLVHPALKEPFGTSLVEGMAAGLAVIAPDLPGPREIVVEDESALFHEPGNQDELARRMARLAGDPMLRVSLGAQGRQRAERLFDVERNMSRLDQICLAVLP